MTQFDLPPFDSRSVLCDVTFEGVKPGDVIHVDREIRMINAKGGVRWFPRGRRFRVLKITRDALVTENGTLFPAPWWSNLRVERLRPAPSREL
jgi:hypothetical protein